MATYVVFDNAIGWAQFRLRGGWKGVIPVTVGFVAILTLAMVLTITLATTAASTVSTMWMGGLLSFQVLLLVVIAPLRTRGAVRADLTTKVIESHRLMPVEPAEAVVGYLFGPNIGCYALALMTLAIGGVAANRAGILVERWLMTNALVAGFGLLLTAIGAFFGFANRIGIIAVFVVVGAVVLSGGYVTVLVPGLLVFCGPFLRHGVFSMQAGTDVVWTYCISVCAQLTVGALYFVATMRRYRGTDATGFTTVMGLALLACWVAASVMGVSFWDDFGWGTFSLGYDNSEQRAQFLTSAIVAMLVATVPVTAAAREQAYRSFRAGGDAPPGGGGRWIPGWLAVPAAVAVIAVVVSAVPFKEMAIVPALCTVAICASFLFSVYCIARSRYAKAPSAFWTLVIWVGATWVVPLVLGLLSGAIVGTNSPEWDVYFSFVAAASPPTALVEVWQPTTWSRMEAVPGILFQVLCTLACVYVFHQGERRRRRRAAATAATEPPLELPPLAVAEQV